MPFTRETRTPDPNELAELFEKQAEPFMKPGFVTIGDTPKDNAHLENLMLRAIMWLKEFALLQIGAVGVGHIPFLLVVPQRFALLETLAPLAKIDNLPLQKGVFRDFLGVVQAIDSEHLVDATVTPNLPYLLVDVENGGAYDETIDITIAGREAMTLVEGISLLHYFPHIVKEHGLRLSGSDFREMNDKEQYSKEQYGCPTICKMLPQFQPFLGFDSMQEIPWGIPSYARRIVAEVESIPELEKLDE